MFISPEKNLSAHLDHLDVDCNARRKIEVREGLDNLWRRIHDVDKALVDAHFELLTAFFIDMRTFDYCKSTFSGRQRDWAANLGAGAQGRIDYLFG